MLKKIIIIENEDEFQSDNLEDIIKVLIDEKYYELPENEKKQKIKIKAIANTLGTKIDIVEDSKDIDGKFIIKDEITYLLSLLIINKIMLLERKDAQVFTKEINTEDFKDNYIIINNNAKDLLKKYLRLN